MLYKNDWSSIQNIPLQEIRMNKYNILQRIKQYIHQLRMQRADEQQCPAPTQDIKLNLDRKSTRLNSSHRT